MERVAWTDERLDDLAKRVDAGFDRVDADLRELRLEVQQGFAEMRGTMLRVGVGVGGGIIAGLIGVIATLLAQGA